MERLDDPVTALCEELLGKVKGCVGIITPTPAVASVAPSIGVTVPAPVASPAPAGVTGIAAGENNPSDVGKEENHEIQVQVSGNGEDSTTVSH